jgi:hypothetical protein
MLKRVKSFTLFELLIVVAIIGVSYGMFTQKLQNRENKEKVNIENFIDKILLLDFKRVASLKCLVEEYESGCRLYLDNILEKDKKIILFSSNDNDEISYFFIKKSKFKKQIEKFIYEDGEKKDTYFQVSIYRSGGYRMFVLKINTSYYLYNSYEKVKKFDELYNAEEFIWKDKELLREIKSI